MATKENGALVEETKALIREVEAGDTDRAAWIAIQDRIKRLYEGRTQREVGELIGKHYRWVQNVLTWDAHRDVHSPHGGPVARERREKSVAKKALRNSESRKQVLADLSKDELREVEDAVWSQRREVDPQVQNIERAVSRDMEKEREARQYPKPTWLDISRLAREASDRAERVMNGLSKYGMQYLQDEDMRAGVLREVESAAAAWQLVASYIKSEGGIDEIEEFLSQIDN